MDKVLIIISDTNKGKFISKGFSSAFRELSYFVIEKKIYDLSIDEVKKVLPDIIFVFWNGIIEKNTLIDFFEKYSNEKTVIIHASEKSSDIPDCVKRRKNNFIFVSDAKTKKKLLLPSVDSKKYKTKFDGYKYNISFCGNPSFNCRETILAALIKEFGIINIFSRSYDFYKSYDEIAKLELLDDYFLELYKASYKGYIDSQKELSQVYCSSKINLDIANENTTKINYRSLEILSSGGFLISPYNDEIISRFEDGHELETYSNIYELIDKIKFYMKNLNLAQLISLKGKKNVASNYSFCDRLKGMLRSIYGKNSGY